MVLVTLDTCRADRLGAYGYAPARTPVMDALAARGRRYDAAYAPAPLTIPAHAALFTGRTPASLGLRTNGGGLAEGEVTLAERFRDAGYTTAASVGAYVTSELWGFGQGFDAYFDDLGGAHLERPGDRVVDDLLGWRSGAGSAPVFAWVHLFDAHDPHVAPDGSAGDPYDAEVAFLDLQVGRLVDAFAARPTVFLVVGDHGEGLGDHGEQEHGLYVYDSTMRVPWLMAGPGVEPGVVTEAVSLVDVAPTLLSHVGLPGLTAASGRVAPGTPPVPVVLESHMLELRFGLAPHRAVVDGGWKLIGLPRPELYDLARDPGELNDLAGSEPERVARMGAALDAAESPSVAAPSRGGPEAAELLAQLGYVEVDAAAPAALGDPKDHQALITALDSADALARTGGLAEALAQLDSVADAYPDVRELTVRRAQLMARTGAGPSAVALLREARARDPDSSVLAEALADVWTAQGSPQEAAAELAGLAAAMPHLPGVHARAFEAWLRCPDGGDEALALGRARLQAEPGDLHMAGLVGVALAGGGSLEEAQELLVRAARAERPVRDVHLYLAQAAHGRGERSAARQHLEAELALDPDHLSAAMALALMLGKASDWMSLLELTSGVLDRASVKRSQSRGPVDGLGPFWALKATALGQLGRTAEARVAVDRGLAEAPELPVLLELDAELKRGGARR